MCAIRIKHVALPPYSEVELKTEEPKTEKVEDEEKEDGGVYHSCLVVTSLFSMVTMLFVVLVYLVGVSEAFYFIHHFPLLLYF